MEEETPVVSSAIELASVSNFILEKIDLKIAEGEMLVLLGPNGSGKSTLLNVMAGFEEFSGSITFQGVPASDLEPAKRGIGYVFQSNALFPHKTVFSNVAFGLEAGGFPHPQISRKVHEILEMLGIDSLSQRYPYALSGGEAKKAALARALARDPRILFLDEPFSGLDIDSRIPLLREFHRIIRKLNLTAILVTHVLEEAKFMSERLALMNHGRLVKVGDFWETFPAVWSSSQPERGETHPDLFLPRYTVLGCEEFSTRENGLAEVRCRGLRLQVPNEGQPFRRLAVDSHAVLLQREPPSFPCMNVFPGIVKRAEFACKGMTLYAVEAGGVELTSVVRHGFPKETDLRCTDCRCGEKNKGLEAGIIHKGESHPQAIQVQEPVQVIIPVRGLHNVP